MSSGISPISASLPIAFARFDRAATAVVASASSDNSSPASDPAELGSAIVAMTSEQLALRVAIEVARVSNEMIDDALTRLVGEPRG